jgi:hypothetical protein
MTRAAWRPCWADCGRRGRASRPPVLLARDPAARVSLDRPYAVAELLDELRATGAQEQAAALAARLPGWTCNGTGTHVKPVRRSNWGLGGLPAVAAGLS